MNPLSKAVSQVIIKYRHQSNLSQEELADLASIHRTYVSQIERGLKSPTLAVIFKISTALKINPSLILKEVELILDELQDK